MSARDFLRNHWRLLLLAVLLIISVYFIFVPGAPITGAAADADPNATTTDTNLQFGIDLAGGARVTAPVHGYHVEDVGVTAENNQQINEEIAAAMNVSTANIITSETTADPDDDFVEVRAAGEREDFVAGLQAAGLDVEADDVENDVRDETRDDVVEVLDQRLGEGGFAGGSVTQLHERDPTQVRVESPGFDDIEELEELIRHQGEVRVVAVHPGEDGSVQRTELYGAEGIETIGSAGVADDGSAGVSVTLTQQAAREKTQFMQESGFDQPEAWRACGNPNDPQPGDWCIQTTLDGEVLFSGNMAPDLGRNFQQPADPNQEATFVVDRSFRMQTGSLEEAQDLRLNIAAGELPAPMNLEQASQMFVSPELAEDFQQNSVLVGLLAVLAVVLMVFLRYGDPKVAAPMSATALSEVVILLGFAAAIGWPLELSHVAGFIAVIGTGVDDLVIIADEIKQQGQVQSKRVFQSRFRKAFWVIGAAAATTIVAMSPLAILNLGDLRGFAIVTILGVLIGVSITRPAYGSILRHLTTGDH